jgi:hypothetical protein
VCPARRGTLPAGLSCRCDAKRSSGRTLQDTTRTKGMPKHRQSARRSLSSAGRAVLIDPLLASFGRFPDMQVPWLVTKKCRLAAWAGDEPPGPRLAPRGHG